MWKLNMHKYSQTPTAHIPVSPPAQLSPKPSPKPSEDLYIAVLASHQEGFSPQPSPSTEPLSQISQVRHSLIWQCISVYFCMFLILSWSTDTTFLLPFFRGELCFFRSHSGRFMLGSNCIGSSAKGITGESTKKLEQLSFKLHSATIFILVTWVFSKQCNTCTFHWKAKTINQISRLQCSVIEEIHTAFPSSKGLYI